ncbi:MAG: serine/threonine-protein kinase [Planctomycetota bacterium]|jgi:serine/threonine-protein kinase
MDREIELKFLALLVHRGLLRPELAKEAIASSDPAGFLIEAGAISAEKWREWVATEGGARPKLSRYELGELLGEGGEARVFRARDRKGGEECALKILRPELSKDPAVVKRFIAESKLLQDLESPHIVRGPRVAREGKVIFAAMEVIDGVCLLDRLDRDGALEEEEVLEIIAQVAAALEHLHSRGLVHRDVKPGNIMLAADGCAKLIDLGFAVGGDAGATETTAGTVHYISPEQARGQSDLDVRADIYSLGATLYHLVTGSLPFSGADSDEVLAKQVLASLSGERIREMDLSPQMHFFIEKMMAKDKAIRFQRPAELIEEIRAYQSQRAHERALDEQSGKRSTRRRRRKWL